MPDPAETQAPSAESQQDTVAAPAAESLETGGEMAEGTESTQTGGQAEPTFELDGEQVSISTAKRWKEHQASTDQIAAERDRLWRENERLMAQGISPAPPQTQPPVPTVESLLQARAAGELIDAEDLLVAIVNEKQQAANRDFMAQVEDNRNSFKGLIQGTPGLIEGNVNYNAPLAQEFFGAVFDLTGGKIENLLALPKERMNRIAKAILSDAKIATGVAQAEWREKETDREKASLNQAISSPGGGSALPSSAIPPNETFEQMVERMKREDTARK